MAEGSRSLLAPWVGGAGSATPQTVGFRSMLAPWFGGIARPSDDQVGVRGMLAPWIGGASVGGGSCGIKSMLAPWMGGACTYPISSPGLTSFMAFWMGGASSSAVTPVPPENESSGPMQPRFRIGRSNRDDEEILMVIAAFLQMVNNE